MQPDIEDDDHIDKSQWLPKGESIITPEREAKGDMHIERDAETQDIKFAQAQIRNILNFLWSRDIITDDQHDAGNVFWAWRNQHRVALGLQRAISTDIAVSSTVKLRAYGYVLLVKPLSVDDHAAIDYAVEMFESSHTRFLALQRRVLYRRAFARLEAILPPIRERIAFLEGLSEEDRDALADEALKNLLAEIVKHV